MQVLVFLCVVGAAFAVREPLVHTCLEDPETGPCRAYMPSFYYDPQTAECKPFIYGGCQGNGNRYITEDECLQHCSGVQVKQEAPDVCLQDKKPGMCLGYFPRFYYDRETGQCTKFIYGGCQANGNNFNTEEECKATCENVQAALDRPDCDKAPETGMCMAYIPRFYYDQEAGMCKKFIYGGCGGNRNNFKTEDECYNKCGALMAPTATACEQEKEVGPCKAAFRRYFFNKQTGQCELFLYGGCSGNDNNFNSQEDCEAVCAARAPIKCSLEADGGLCRGYFPMYYFDSKDGQCKEFIYGGCDGNDNRFGTKEECEADCKA